MKVKPMLMRLQNALGQDNLADQMLLLQGSGTAASIKKHKTTVNFVTGYSGSPNSQTALDFTLWIAHQTRLATQKQVTVHVVYVLDSNDSVYADPIASDIPAMEMLSDPLLNLSGVSRTRSTTATLSRSEASPGTIPTQQFRLCSLPIAALTNPLEKADRILWQARCLADEWRGSLEAHLRFGDVATELRSVADEVIADLLFVGCRSAEHPLIQQLTTRFPCPVLGVPRDVERSCGVELSNES
jgi:nucleotide-binding universal stress UspA family protein